MSKDNVVKNDTCFGAHLRNCISCKKSECRYWIDASEFHNCTIIAAETNQGMTLEHIGQVFNLTRMRVCQIEKTILKKINTESSTELLSSLDPDDQT